MQYPIIFVISYLFGSIPAAYLFLKFIHKTDITDSGSGNVGALNSMRVSSSAATGIAVFLFDFGKGLLSVYLASLISPENFFAVALALLASVTAHCFNPWLKFKGGRGLATGAGGVLMISPVILILWLVLWAIGYAFRKDIHFASASATLLSVALVWNAGDIINKYTFPPAAELIYLQITTTALFAIIFIKHWEPLKLYFGNQRVKK